jgi:HK97 family phage major capsid protein
MTRTQLQKLAADERAAATAIHQACSSGDTIRLFTAEEQTRFDAHLAKVEMARKQLEALDRLGPEPEPVVEPSTRQSSPSQFAGQSPAVHTRQHRYSVLRAISAACDERRVDGLEGEVSTEVRKKGRVAGRTYRGQFTMPLDPEPELRAMMYPDYREPQRRDLTTTTGTGGIFTVPEMPMIEYLRAKMVVSQLGCTWLTNMQGLFAIPRQSGKLTVNWISSEGGTGTNSNLTLDQVAFSPKLLIAITNISRQFINQTSVSAEALAMDDLSLSVAVELDRVAINGLGSGGQPTGILQNSTISTNSAGLSNGPSGGVVSWGDIVNMETQIANYNADQGILKYLTNPIMRGTLKQTVKVPSSTFPIYIWEDGPDRDGVGTMNGYEARTTTNVPSNLTKGSGSALSAVILGYWPGLVVATWDDGIDYLVNPYSNQSSAAVLISAEVSTDVEVRHPENFATMTDCVGDAY